MSPQKDAFQKEVNVQVNGDRIKIITRNSGPLKLIVTLSIISFLVMLILMGGTPLGNFFLAVIAGVVAWIGWQEFKRTLYPVTELDLRAKEVILKPAYAFFKAKRQRFKEMKGISVSTKTIGGHTSAYEEGNTDYEKILLLETDSGEIPILTYVSREEATESGLAEFANAIRVRLSANVSG